MRAVWQWMFVVALSVAVVEPMAEAKPGPEVEMREARAIGAVPVGKLTRVEQVQVTGAIRGRLLEEGVVVAGKGDRLRPAPGHWIATGENGHVLVGKGEGPTINGIQTLMFKTPQGVIVISCDCGGGDKDNCKFSQNEQTGELVCVGATADCQCTRSISAPLGTLGPE